MLRCRYKHVPRGEAFPQKSGGERIRADDSAKTVPSRMYLDDLRRNDDCENDIVKAQKYFTAAADAGMPLAAYHLALLYQQPEICNYHKAFRYAGTAAERGVPEGEFIYGTMLLMGRGCEADVHEGVRYLREAAAHGIYQAKAFLEEYEAG